MTRRRAPGRWSVAALAVALGACASMSQPPGGPPDKLPPKLLQVVPESGAVNTAPRAVVFRFDEVVNERPSGASKLDDMFLVSPRPRSVDVEWNREEVWIRPAGGWRKGITYAITMLPGMSDLRGNVLKAGTSLVFSTGAEIPSSVVRGVLFDWPRGTPAIQTLVEAVDKRDTTIQYVAVTDSTGRFTLRYLPPGDYLVRAAVAGASSLANAATALRPFDRRRAWDSTSVILRDSVRVELLAFQHDTLGPRISALTVRDSLTLKLTLDQPIPAGTPLAREQFRLLTKDSTELVVDSIFTAEAFAEWEKKGKEAEAAAKARADSITADSVRRAAPPAAAAPGAAPPRAGAPATPARPGAPAGPVRTPPGAPAGTPPAGGRPGAAGAANAGAAGGPLRAPLTRADSADSVRKANLPKPSKPVPVNEFVLRLAQPLAPQSAYRLGIRGIAGLLGASRPSDRAFTTPKPPAKDSTKAPGAPGGAGADAAARPAGGTRPPPGFTPPAPRDSTRKPPGAP